MHVHTPVHTHTLWDVHLRVPARTHTHTPVNAHILGGVRVHTHTVWNFTDYEMLQKPKKDNSLS